MDTIIGCRLAGDDKNHLYIILVTCIKLLPLVAASLASDKGNIGENQKSNM